jgi:hypothetical protein
MPRRKKQLPPEEKSQPAVPVYTGYNPVARRWLWILVSTFTIIIGIMWLWATKISFSYINWNRAPEKKILDTGKTDWDSLFNSETSLTQQTQIKAQLKNMLQKITETTTSTSSTQTNIFSTSTTSTYN